MPPEPKESPADGLPLQPITPVSADSNIVTNHSLDAFRDIAQLKARYVPRPRIPKTPGFRKTFVPTLGIIVPSLCHCRGNTAQPYRQAHLAPAPARRLVFRTYVMTARGHRATARPRIIPSKTQVDAAALN
jgi:hypothetical protein